MLSGPGFMHVRSQKELVPTSPNLVMPFFFTRSGENTHMGGRGEREKREGRRERGSEGE